MNAGLTPRERDVAVLAAQGFTAVEIADRLGITVGTARNYVLNVRRKFGSVPKRRLALVLGMVGDVH
uniref:helix-turn-helix domain-containing protein n=1 Tax=Streptomyces calvus TaxID=67282 RepID=UPI003518AB88